MQEGGAQDGCSRCKAAAFCSKDCLKAAWKEHKPECTAWANLKQELETDREKLRSLREGMNEQLGAWPQTGETPAMINARCFLSVHERQRFVPELRVLPGGVPAGVVLSEDTGGLSPEEYSKIVPTHIPTRLLVVGECVLTADCVETLTEHYKRNRGTFFEWPGAEVIWRCPVTGRKHDPNHQETLLLVIQTMFGLFIPRSGTGSQLLTRQMPRLLSLEGYERMMNKRTLPATTVKKDAATGAVIDETVHEVPVYPDAVVAHFQQLRRQHEPNNRVEWRTWDVAKKRSSASNTWRLGGCTTYGWPAVASKAGTSSCSRTWGGPWAV